LLQDVNSPKELNISVKTFYNYLKFLEENPKETSPEKLYAEVDNIVDVRDVASAQVEALLSPKAGGERFIISGCTSSSFSFLEINVLLIAFSVQQMQPLTRISVSSPDHSFILTLTDILCS
jgi:hypothetical protein